MAQPASARSFEFNQALVSIEADAAQGASVQTLPYKWDTHQPGASGVATFSIDFELPTMDADPEAGLFGLYIPHVGNAYQVFVNGSLLAGEGNLTEQGHSDTSKMPRFFEISPFFLSGHNNLTVRISADAGRRAGLSTMWLGPKQEVEDRYLHDWWWRYMLSWGVLTFSIVVGTLALVLWLLQIHHHHGGETQSERLYLYAGLAEWCWAFKVGDVFIENPLLPWHYWLVLITAALAGWIYYTAMFCAQTLGWQQKPGFVRFRALVWLVSLAGVAAAAASVFANAPKVMTLWMALYGAIFLVFGVLFVRRALAPESSWKSRLLALAIVVNVAVGCYDIYSVRVNPKAGDVLHIYYSSVLFGAGILFTVLQQFRSAVAHARELKISAERRLLQVESELREVYRHAEATATAQARVQERTRILRDMHDGVGSHISIAIRQLQTAGIDQHSVVQTLRESLDHLKLSIDSMNMPVGDMEALLASLRYRLTARLQAAGITLHWQVDDLPQIPGMDDLAMRGLLLMLYEAFSNACQHAKASDLTLSASVTGQQVCIALTDNGVGFVPAEVAKRSGIKMLYERAASLRVGFSISSQPGRTRLEWLLDLTATGAAAER